MAVALIAYVRPVASASRSSASAASRISGAPAWIRPCVPALRRDVTSPGTAPTARPSSAAKSAVVSEPERSVAWTTTVAALSAAMMRLRATKHQRWASAPGGISEITAPRLATAAWSRHPRRGYGDVGAGGEHGDRLAGRLERSFVGGRVDPEREPGDHRHARGREPAAQRPGDLEAIGRGAAGSHDGDRVVVVGEGPEDVDHRGRVGEVAQPGRVGVAAAADRGQPRGRGPFARGGRIESVIARARRAVRDLEQVVVGKRQHAPGRGALLELDLQPAGHRRDQVRAPQAVVAGAHLETSSPGVSASLRKTRRSRHTSLAVQGRAGAPSRRRTRGCGPRRVDVMPPPRAGGSRRSAGSWRC